MVVDIGETVSTEPVLFGFPSAACVHDEFVYHFQLAPLPSVPSPLTLSAIDPPRQIVEGLGNTCEGAVDAVRTVTVPETHPVFPQLASALTK